MVRSDLIASLRLDLQCDILSNDGSMTRRDSRAELLEARSLLEQMYVEMDELETRIAKQKRVVAALTELADVDQDTEPPEGLVKGITDACKTAVLGATKPLYPSEVRDRIKTLGFPEQKNLLASVHTVLKRLAEAGEIKVTDGGAYRRMTLGERIALRPNHESATEALKKLERERLAFIGDETIKNFSDLALEAERSGGREAGGIKPTLNPLDPLGKGGQKPSKRAK